MAEKKAAILEAALRHHPGSDRLLLALLACAEALAAGPELLERCGPGLLGFWSG